jgi:serine protease AprX
LGGKVSIRFTIRRSGIAFGLALTLGASLVAPAAHATTTTAPVAPTYGPNVTDPAQCPGTPIANWSPANDPYSPTGIAKEIGAPAFYNAADGSHYLGQGQDIALIDSGVNDKIPGLNWGDIVQGPDFSFEANSPTLGHSDTYGHGSDLAGIINGLAPGPFVGLSPLSKILSVRVADANGAVDVSQIVAAIYWVAEHPHYKGLNIRVINLAFGLKTGLDYRTNPIAKAAEVAEKKTGILVVVAAGNDGNGRREPGGVSAPGNDPNLLTVGSYDDGGTPGVPADDKSSLFTSGGGNHTMPDVIAPGEHVMSLHDAGAHEDDEIKHDCETAVAAGKPWGSPMAGTSSADPDQFVRASGTSQATAIVSAAAALILSRNPALRWDQVIELLRESARQLPGAPATLLNGEGAINLAAAYNLAAPAHSLKTYNEALGKGSLDHARGADPLPCMTRQSIIKNRGELERGVLPPVWDGGLCADIETRLFDRHLPMLDATSLDVFGNPLDVRALATAGDAGTVWADNPDGSESFMGSKWLVGDAGGGLVLDQTDHPTDWMGNSWNTVDLEGHTWNGNTWRWDALSGHTWHNSSWSGAEWDSDALLGNTWRDGRWSGNTWRDNAWP